jgi:hypothetical protein
VQYILTGFEHQGGLHCGSTALVNICRYHGHDLSEALCFGLASGLNFFYVSANDLSPSRVFNGRVMELELNFFRNLGMPLTWHESDSMPWSAMRDWVSRDVPILLLTDLYYLDYYKSRVHFPGHAVVMVGFDDATGEAILSDTDRDGLQRVGRDTLEQAMSSRAFPLPLNNYWHEVPPFELPDLRGPVRRALRRAVEEMLSPAMPAQGMPAMRVFAAEMADWHQADDWRWCARFGYEVIERRGTVGGAFRTLYADFLAEITRLVPELARIEAAPRMRTISQTWTALAAALKRIWEELDPARFAAAADIAADVTRQEESFWEDLRGLLI